MDVFGGLLFSQPQKAGADGGRVQLGSEAQTPKCLCGLWSICCSCSGPATGNRSSGREALLAVTLNSLTKSSFWVPVAAERPCHSRIRPVDFCYLGIPSRALLSKAVGAKGRVSCFIFTFLTVCRNREITPSRESQGRCLIFSTCTGKCCEYFAF